MLCQIKPIIAITSVAGPSSTGVVSNNVTSMADPHSGAMASHIGNLLPQKRKIDDVMQRQSTKRNKSNADEEIDTNRCCVCFGTYKEDAGTERERLLKLKMADN